MPLPPFKGGWKSHYHFWKRQSEPERIDDIIFFSKTVHDRLTRLWRVLKLLRNAWITLNLKCYTFAKTFKYLGHVIQPGRLAVTDTTTMAIHELQDHTTETERQSSVTLCNIFRQSLPSVSQLAAPLSTKLRKDQLNFFAELTVEEKQSVND